MIDVVVAGGGPVGLATAIALELRGMSTRVLEPRPGPVDKACGEGLMPPALVYLEALGVLPLVRKYHPFYGVSYQVEGASASARFEEGAAWGVRRSVLSEALIARLRQLNPESLVQTRLKGWQDRGDAIVAETEAGSIPGRYLVGADGLNSRVRKLAGLDAGYHPVKRWGIRRHFRVRPWFDKVTVLVGRGVEAYLTPVDEQQIGVALLFYPWARERLEARGKDEIFLGLLAQFPALAERLRDCPPTSQTRAVGPLWRKVHGVCRGRVALVGDASGYVDALTGEGITLGLAQSALLVRHLAENRLADYPRAHAQVSLGYKLSTRGLLALTRYQPVARATVAVLDRCPAVFATLLRWALPHIDETMVEISRETVADPVRRPTRPERPGPLA